MTDGLKAHEQEIEMLVERAKEGNSEAFAKLYDFYIDPIYRYIYFKVPKEEALDLTESVFLKVWENLHSYKPKEGSRFSSWIFRIAHNIVVDQYRLHKELMPLEDNIVSDQRESDPVYLAEKALNQDTLHQAIAKLNKKYQQIIILKYINDLGNQEIANIMQKSEGSIRILKFRALRALKKVLLEMGTQF